MSDFGKENIKGVFLELIMNRIYDTLWIKGVVVGLLLSAYF